MKYLHTMIRVTDIDASLGFFNTLGLKETRRKDSEAGRYTLIFLAADESPDAEMEAAFRSDDKVTFVELGVTAQEASVAALFSNVLLKRLSATGIALKCWSPAYALPSIPDLNAKHF